MVNCVFIIMMLLHRHQHHHHPHHDCWNRFHDHILHQHHHIHHDNHQHHRHPRHRCHHDCLTLLIMSPSFMSFCPIETSHHLWWRNSESHIHIQRHIYYISALKNWRPHQNVIEMAPTQRNTHTHTHLCRGSRLPHSTLKYPPAISWLTIRWKNHLNNKKVNGDQLRNTFPVNLWTFRKRISLNIKQLRTWFVFDSGLKSYGSYVALHGLTVVQNISSWICTR